MHFVRSFPKPIPSRLFHFTRGEAALNILGLGKETEKDICFWAKNAINKNDKFELELGQKLLQKVRWDLVNKGRHSLLDQIKINPEKVFLISFTESDKANEHMLKEYGNFRLEFDFRNHFNSLQFRECDYIVNEDTHDLAEAYCSDFDEYWEALMRNKYDFSSLIEYINTETSIISSIPFLKHLEEWSDEREWRHVLHRQPVDDRIFFCKDGTPRMKVYYPVSYLVGVTCYLDNSNKNDVLPYYYKIRYWAKNKGLGSIVKIEQLD